MTDRRLLLGPLVVLVAIVVSCFVATQDTPGRTSIPPRVLDAQLRGSATTGTELRVRAQDPDGTIVGLTVRWADGQVSTARLPCEPGDYGGRTIAHTFSRRDDVAAEGAQVRATAESCFGAQPRHSGGWAAATAAD